MRKNKIWIKYIAYFFIGYLIFIILSSLTQISMYRDLGLDIAWKTILLYMMKNGIFLYSVIYILIVTLNILYNVNIAKKLNEKSQKLRKASEERILKERRRNDMIRRILIIVLIIMLTLSVISVANTIRKFMILKDLQAKASMYENKDNVYKKIIYNNGAPNEIFVKGNLVKQIMRIPERIGQTLILMEEPHETRAYLITPDTKTLSIEQQKNENLIASYYGGINIFDTLKDATIHEFLHHSIISKIETEEIDGQECYVINNLEISAHVAEAVSEKFYVNKETGLTMKIIETIEGQNGEKEEHIQTIEQKFDVVTDEDMQEPNREEFTIVQNHRETIEY